MGKLSFRDDARGQQRGHMVRNHEGQTGIGKETKHKIGAQMRRADGLPFGIQRHGYQAIYGTDFDGQTRPHLPARRRHDLTRRHKGKGQCQGNKCAQQDHAL